MDKFNKKTIIISAIIAICVLTVATIIIFIVKYNVEGEKNLPFQITSIKIASTAQGEPTPENVFNLNIIQKNDFYFYIEKNPKYTKEDSISKVSFENFNIKKDSDKGNINIYKPSTDIRLYSYTDEYKVDNSLSYTGALSTNIQSLDIGNQGGLIGFSIAINDLGNYLVDANTTVTHDGTLLSGIDITQEDISMKVSFDVIIETSSKKKYKTTLSFDLPTGNIIEEGMSAIEKTDTNDIVYKRFRQVKN